MKPFFLRALNFKKGTDILELFEQIKLKLQLNSNNLRLPIEEQNELLHHIKTDFYKEFIDVCLKKKAFAIADIAFSDYTLQITEKNPNDLLGLKISCLKDDIEGFEEHFNRILQTSEEENIK